MQFYEHPGQVSVPTPLLRALTVLGFYDSSYGNDVWPGFSYDVPTKANEVQDTVTIYFVGEADEDGDAQPGGSLLQELYISWNSEEGDTISLEGGLLTVLEKITLFIMKHKRE